MDEATFRDAVSLSGFPLQILVAAALQDRGFHVQEEWAYLDPDSDERRALDIVGRRYQSDSAFVSEKGGSLLSTALLVECKRSTRPYLFFESVNPPTLGTFPPVVGLGNGRIRLSPADAEANWIQEQALSHFLGADAEPFVLEPLVSASVSRAVPNGKKIEISGDEPYRSLLLPLTKAMTRYMQEASGARNAGRIQNVVVPMGLAVFDAPMIFIGRPADELRIEPITWTRIVVRNPATGEANRWNPLGFKVVDAIHESFLDRYLEPASSCKARP
jgi:hypothetical protein